MFKVKAELIKVETADRQFDVEGDFWNFIRFKRGISKYYTVSKIEKKDGFLIAYECDRVNITLWIWIAKLGDNKYVCIDANSVDSIQDFIRNFLKGGAL